MLVYTWPVRADRPCRPRIPLPGLHARDQYLGCPRLRAHDRPFRGINPLGRAAREKRDLSALGFLVVVPPVSILLYLPYHLQLAATGYLGIFTVTTPSDPWEFLLVHGFFLAIFLAYGARSLIKRPYLLLPALLVGLAGFASAAIALAAGTALLARWERRPEVLMALAGISLITLTEFFYLKDYLGGIYTG